eukprot:403335477
MHYQNNQRIGGFHKSNFQNSSHGSHHSNQRSTSPHDQRQRSQNQQSQFKQQNEKVAQQQKMQQQQQLKDAANFSLSSIHEMSDFQADQLIANKNIETRITYGMPNLGNTCFFNSVMQCLTHTKPLFLYCASKEHYSKCQKRESCFLCTYTQYILKIQTDKRAQPQLIVSRLKTIWNRYRVGQQEDAHEFLILFLESFINSCFQTARPPRDIIHKHQYKTPILKIFGGKSRSQVHCLGCNYKSNTFEDLITLSLDLPFGARGKPPGPMTFESCLNRFCTSEHLKGENKYQCSNCKKKCEATKRFSIDKTPRILIIHFKRFDAFGRKVPTFIKYPQSFSLKEFTSQSIDAKHDPKIRQELQTNTDKNSQELYDLFGVVVHMGGGCRSGHYYSYCKNSTGNWYECDDSSISTSSTEQALKQQAYVLFYQKRIQTPKEPKKIEKEIKIPDEMNIQKVDKTSQKLQDQHNNNSSNNSASSSIQNQSMISTKSNSQISNNSSDREASNFSDEVEVIKRYPSMMPSQKQQSERVSLAVSEKSDVNSTQQIKPLNITRIQEEEKTQGNNELFKKEKVSKQMTSSVQDKAILICPEQSKKEKNILLSLINKVEQPSKKEKLKSKPQEEQKLNISKVQQVQNSGIVSVQTFHRDPSQDQQSSKVQPMTDIFDKPTPRVIEVKVQQQTTLQISQDEQILASLNPPPLIKQSSSKSGSFIGSLRRDLHPVVVTKASKKRKRSAIGSITQQNKRLVSQLKDQREKSQKERSQDKVSIERVNQEQSNIKRIKKNANL